MPELFDIPKPQLDARLLGARRIPALTDDALVRATGVRIAFTGRAGGASEPPYDTLNLGSHVGDSLDDVLGNRAALLQALGAPHAHLVVPNQVHGTDGAVYDVPDPARIRLADGQAQAGADFVVVGVDDVAALLCFADCAPVVIASPTGRFAVAHAGWRGAVAHIAAKAARRLTEVDRPDLGDRATRFYNAYIGPHIHAECFECGEDVVGRFRREFGEEAIADACHVSLEAAVRIDLQRAGLSRERIVDAGACTKCHPETYYSYRASGGVCGRHGAIAVRVRQGAVQGGSAGQAAPVERQ